MWSRPVFLVMGCDETPDPEAHRDAPSKTPSEEPRPTDETPSPEDESPPWGLEGQVLASVPGVSTPVPKGPVVYITQDRVESGGSVLGKIDAEGQLELGVRASPEDPDVVNADQSVVFVVDQRVRASVVRTLVGKSFDAKFLRHALVVKGGTAIELGPSDPSAPPEHVLEVLVTPEMLVAGERGGNATRIEPLADGERNWSKLASQVGVLREAHPEVNQVWVQADDVDFGTLARTLAAARGPDCERDNDCLLPILEGSVREPEHVALDPEPDEQQVGILGMLAAGKKDPYEIGQSGIGPGSDGSIEIGTIGVSAGGADGGGDRDSGEKVPRVLAQKISVKGSLDKDIVRRIVRRHIGEVRSCYSDGLSRDPTLAGSLSIQFMISASGEVSVAILARSDLPDEKVGKCIAKAFRRWKFPKTRGDVVAVTYPFKLEPG